MEAVNSAKAIYEFGTRICLYDGLGNYIYSLAPVNFCSLLKLDSKYTHYTLRLLKAQASFLELDFGMQF